MNNPLQTLLAHWRAAGWTAKTPRWMRALGYRMLGGVAADEAMWRAQYRVRLAGSTPAPPQTAFTVGIVTDAMCRHGFYELACRELGVPYRLIDITGAAWRQVVMSAGCDAFVVWPYVQTAAGKALYDERTGIMERELGLRVFPGAEAVWLYESKIRTAAWLDQHAVPQPVTHVFHDAAAAHGFVREADFPLVFKTDRGAEATGVRMLRDRRAAHRLVDACFGRGWRASRGGQADRERGHILLQEFIPDAREWRVVRIGDSYFGHRKGRKGDFHSGSKIIEFDTPPRRLLDGVRHLTDAGSFVNMACDILETRDGEYRTIELHAYFGCNSPYVMAIDGVPGRYLYRAAEDRYVFEPGDFNRNQSCNLRIATLLGMWDVGGGT